LKTKRGQNNFLIIVSIIVIILSILFLVYRTRNAKRIGDKTPDTQDYINSNPDNNQEQYGTLELNYNQGPAYGGAQPWYSDKQIPIFMYHHIRDFNDPADQIGTNLSVPVADFASQLDDILNRGYQAINFNDLLSKTPIEKPIILTFDDGYANFYQNAYPELKKRNFKAVVFIISSKIGANDYLTADQIIELDQNNIEIGSHTISHLNLAASDSANATQEITGSKNILEDLIGRPVISFCYPIGKYTADSEAMVKNAGYQFAVTTKTGITNFLDPFALTRYRVNHGTNIRSWIK